MQDKTYTHENDMLNSYEEQTIKRYSDRLKAYGVGPKALGWDKGKQDLRYASLLDSLPDKVTSIVDVGCGFADGLKEIEKKINLDRYVGIDINEELIEIAEKRWKRDGREFIADNYQKITLGKNYEACVASGLMNFKESSIDNMYLLSELINFCKRNNIRFLAFDCLSPFCDIKKIENNYFSVEELLGLITKFTRRFKLDMTYQPFEMVVYLDLDDQIDLHTTTYK